MSSRCICRYPSAASPADTQVYQNTGESPDKNNRKLFCLCVSGRDQQAEVLSWSQVGVAKVTGSLENSDDTLHVTGEAEAVMSHDQQLYN